MHYVSHMVLMQLLAGNLVYWSVSMRLKSTEGDVMLNLIWRVSLHPAVNLSVCSYVNGQLVLDALTFCPFSRCPTLSELQLDVVCWSVTDCGYMTAARDLRELSFEESRGERCLSGAACAESKLFWETWTYICCDYVWRSQCSTWLAVLVPDVTDCNRLN